MLRKRVLILTGLAAMLPHQVSAADLGVRGFGGQLGIAGTGVGSTVSFGAHMSAGEFMPNLQFRPSVSYWSKSAGTLYGQWKFSELRLNADVRYMFMPENLSFQPYAGGGLALARYSISGQSRYDGFVGGAQGTQIEFNLLGGAEMPLTPSLSGFGELRVENSAMVLSLGITMQTR